MSDTEVDRVATRKIAASIVASARDGASPSLPFDWPEKVPLDCPDCPVTAAEELIVQLAREIVMLTKERKAFDP